MGDDQKTQEYLVTWSIEVDAATPLDAAKLAHELSQEPESTATVYKVHPPDDEEPFEIDIGLLQINYQCPRCGVKWTDYYDSAVDADCIMKCGARDIQPYKWERV